MQGLESGIQAAIAKTAETEIKRLFTEEKKVEIESIEVPWYSDEEDKKSLTKAILGCYPNAKVLAKVTDDNDLVGYLIWVKEKTTRALVVLGQNPHGGKQFRIISGNRQFTRKLVTKYQKAINSCIPPKGEDIVRVKFWNFSDGQVRCRFRYLTCPALDQIKENYHPETLKSIQWLANLKKPYDIGKLAFWMGAPGTGKTFCIRALLHTWKENAEIHIITDPEAFFQNAGYMLDVLNESETGKFNLVIMEDSPRIVLQESRVDNTTYAMSRFLNMTDGLLGQGIPSLFLLTTNDDVADIDLAFLRSGRCLQRIEFKPLDSDQANTWLKKKKIKERVDEPIVLSELYRLTKKVGADIEELNLKEPLGFGIPPSAEPVPAGIKISR